MGRLGLGVPEAVLAGAKKTVLLRPHGSLARLTDAALVKPFGTVFRIPFGTLLLRIPLGIPMSWM